MLAELTVENLGLIEEAELHFNPGFNVITGETGAGKSMLLGAVRLLTGGRSDAKAVLSGAAKANVDSVWLPSARVAEYLNAKEVSFDDEELFVSRSVQNDGKSRLLLSGRPVPTSYMSELAEELIEIHGQSDQLKLKNPELQRQMLDAFGGAPISEELKSYSVAYDKWNKLRKQLKDARENVGKREIELQYNRGLVERFDELDPQDNELDELTKEISKIRHLEDISEGLQETLSILLPEESESPSNLINQAVSTLLKLSKYDERLSEIADLIDSGLKSLEPGIQELEDYANEIDLDSLQRLRELEDRVTELKIFAKPFGGDLERAIEASLKAQEFLAAEDAGLDIEELEVRLEGLANELKETASSLTDARMAAGDEFSKAINGELAGLAMKGTELVVQFTSREPASHGADIVEFMVETKGSNRRPIAKAASGGELSRIMVALELVTAANSAPDTIIFDEIDSGVGGATAIEIGRRLAKLGKTHQIIVVSHLPQVAAWADAHFLIAKDEEEAQLRTSVTAVTDDSRVREIARMLSGLADSDTGLAHAEELLSMTTQVKPTL